MFNSVLLSNSVIDIDYSQIFKDAFEPIKNQFITIIKDLMPQIIQLSLGIFIILFVIFWFKYVAFMSSSSDEEDDVLDGVNIHYYYDDDYNYECTEDDYY